MVIRDISEIDRIEYDKLECPNMSLQEFSKMRQKEERESLVALENYKKSLQPDQSDNQLFKTVKFLKPQSGAVPRTIIIDGANILHCGSGWRDTRNNSQHTHIPDVQALLAVLRFFIVRDFDVVTVLSKKYTRPDVTNYDVAIAELIQENLCLTVPSSNLDDTIALEFAMKMNGIVVSSDRFRDHAMNNIRYVELVTENRLGIKWERKKRGKYTYFNNKELDFTGMMQFRFETDNESLSSANSLERILYSRPGDLHYEMSRERYNSARTVKRKERILRVLNRLIVDSTSECEINVERINSIVIPPPVNVPTRINAPTRTVPVDPQASHIADYDDDGF